MLSDPENCDDSSSDRVFFYYLKIFQQPKWSQLIFGPHCDDVIINACDDVIL